MNSKFSTSIPMFIIFDNKLCPKKAGTTRYSLEMTVDDMLLLTATVLKMAALNGCIRCIMYIYNYDKHGSKNAMGLAWDRAYNLLAAGDHLECIMYLNDRGLKMPRGMCRVSAMNGHLSILMYAHTNGCDWDETACASAARNGQLLCLQYLIDNGCRYDKNSDSYYLRYPDFIIYFLLNIIAL